MEYLEKNSKTFYEEIAGRGEGEGGKGAWKNLTNLISLKLEKFLKMTRCKMLIF